MTAQVILIRDYHLKKIEKKAAEVMAQIIDYSEVARLGGPGGVDDLIITDTSPCEMVHYHADQDPA
jgi:hypothetical protein